MNKNYNTSPSCNIKINTGVKNIPALEEPIEYFNVKLFIGGLTEEQCNLLVKYTKSICKVVDNGE